ncbi:hypothetical protein QE385_003954 [Sphingomonas sp. SORGH_AS 950]|uniref:hypothetical protein n=1 Tax=Sphingomonas sp. SORGH_AS_0950 TaxID=3041792 RepID=UPI00278B42AA|nr:hypothetical protein [Sphingomonas sp. SORGH_AS_0950]MDQ1159557.1 hypothetical protein [Sphingomonas sp. SORGH_AS_0950]
MTPDVYSNLTVLNITGQDITTGGGGDNAGFFHQYQMFAWFNAITNPYPALIAPSKGSATYLMQFYRGVGDEDDAADIQMNAGNQNRGAENVVWLQARSNDNSSHYIQAVVQNATAHGGPYVIAFTKTGPWPATPDAVSTLTWAGSGNTVGTGTPNTDQTLAIIDLGALFPSDVAKALAVQICNGALSDLDAETIWYQCMIYLGRLV